MTVAATDANDLVADFSTQSRGIDLAAPGVGIVASVSDDEYGAVDGTSFSAPIVSGAAAWLWTARPELDKTQVIELLRSTARDVGKKGRDSDTGFGVLDIAAALAAPAPPVDPSEPNDDVDEVTAGGIFGHAKAPIVGLKGSSASFPARLDAVEDAKDVYRVLVEARPAGHGVGHRRHARQHLQAHTRGLAARHRDGVGERLAPTATSSPAPARGRAPARRPSRASTTATAPTTSTSPSRSRRRQLSAAPRTTWPSRRAARRSARSKQK